MSLRSIVSVMCITCFICAWSTAQDEPAPQPPAPAPATQPATAPADTSTPKGTLKVLADAMERGDAETLRSLLLAEGTLETRMRDARIGVSQATAQLREALVDAFGEQVLAELNSHAKMQEHLASIETAPVELNGETARVTVGPDRYDLKRIDGKWKLLLSAATKHVDAKMLEQSLQEMSIRSAVYKETAEEVAEGKYQSTEEVGLALQGKLMVAMMREASATQPASTQPK